MQNCIVPFDVCTPSSYEFLSEVFSAWLETRYSPPDRDPCSEIVEASKGWDMDAFVMLEFVRLLVGDSG
jgi:hypothetical protein